MTDPPPYDADPRAWVHRPSLRVPTGLVDFARSRFVGEDGRVEPLTTREAALLAHLAEHANEPVSRDELLGRVWGHHELSLSRAVDATIRRVRQKIEPDSAQPRALFTVHGHGYRLLVAEPVPAAPAAAEPAPRRLLRLGARTAELAAGYVEHDGARTALTTKERLLLEHLLAARGAAVDADRLARKVGVIGGKTALGNTVYRLRAKLEDDPRAPRFLVTVPGGQYRLDARSEEPSIDDAQLFRALRSLTAHVGLVLGLDDCVVYVRRGDALQQVAAHGPKCAPDGSVVRPLTQRLGEGLVGAAAVEDRPVCVADVRTDPRYLEDLEPARSELAVPVCAHGRVVGVLDSESRHVATYDERMMKVFLSLAAIAAPAFERSAGASDA